MNIVSGYIVEIEVLDKRHADMKSSTMEKKALKLASLRLQNTVKVAEVCTDASTSIQKLMSENKIGICIVMLLGWWCCYMIISIYEMANFSLLSV